MTATQLAPQYDPSAIESSIYERWRAAGVFTPRGAGAPYVIVIPPPNVTDRLHMGHGLNNTLQDVLIRFERMRGRDALWLPGTDHAGIATQNVVERIVAREGATRDQLGRDRFEQRIWQYVRETGDTILHQLEAIGASCDWSRTRFTLDDRYSAAVRHVFVALYKDGLIYRGHRVIHWCPRCQTSLSDEEAEFRDTTGQLYHIRYALVPSSSAEASERGGAGDGDPRAYVVVATTRPETMFGDIAVVYHPDDERFAHLSGRTVEIPLSGIRIPVRTHEAVDREFGTGLLKVTPAHDPNDFDIGTDLDGGAERPLIMEPDGRMSDVERVPAEVRDVDRFEARKLIVERLRQAGQLEKVEAHTHAVRHCYRCDTVVEPRLSDQWFVKMQPLAAPALEAFRQGRLRFVPERWGTTYERWLSEIRDWNISRQLWWGHRIPAWYCEAAGSAHITVSETDPVVCETCGSGVRQDPDVLDTWFSSWLWPFATLGWPEETADLARYYPGHTLVTGPDIIFFWVARMVMAGYHFLGERPFETVFLNGIVRDPQHRKMSKSLGNGIDPLDVVDRFGADALRYTVVTQAAIGTDVILDPDDLETSFGGGRNFANKLWNVGRLILTHLDDEPRPIGALDPHRMELADRWILSRVHRASAEVTGAFERFRLNDAALLVYHFLWDELADWYLEQVKPRLYGDRDGGDVARTILASVFETALRLLHPVMPYITEELWTHLPGEREELLAGAAWPVTDARWRDPEAEDRFTRVQALVGAVRAVRAEYHVAPGRTVPAYVQPSSLDAAEAFNAEQRTIERLAKIEPLRFRDNGSGAGAHAVLPDGSAVFVPLGDAIDIGRECERLGEALRRLDGQLAGVRQKLANPQFTSRAPAEVVSRERDKEQSWREQRDTLAEKLRALGC